MLLIEAELRNSTINGVGLFCIEPLAKGTKVYEFHPLFDQTFNEADIFSLPRPVQSFLRKYAYRSVETNEWIVGIDLARHMNHSDTPSLISDAESNYYAAYDLPPGSELTCDYRVFALEGCSNFLQQRQDGQPAG